METNIEEGMIIEVDNKEGIVIYTKKYNEKEYAIVRFKNVPIEEELGFYTIVLKDNDIFFKEEKDEEVMADLMILFNEYMHNKIES